ncbi:hypothetical protein I4F81_003303 [Pyropia yezoensis]|uniref:Uncharacterized protein n=1 Tax=Pyropia yezoensis TaxID=2788 RepID=A0ACC3BRU9_PYRYE|nr:hypothetical protein I4F81_003303 [Neopyropia yezoensis]
MTGRQRSGPPSTPGGADAAMVELFPHCGPATVAVQLEVQCSSATPSWATATFGRAAAAGIIRGTRGASSSGYRTTSLTTKHGIASPPAQNSSAGLTATPATVGATCTAAPSTLPHRRIDTCRPSTMATHTVAGAFGTTAALEKVPAKAAAPPS